MLGDLTCCVVFIGKTTRMWLERRWRRLRAFYLGTREPDLAVAQPVGKGHPAVQDLVGRDPVHTEPGPR